MPETLGLNPEWEIRGLQNQEFGNKSIQALIMEAGVWDKFDKITDTGKLSLLHSLCDILPQLSDSEQDMYGAIRLSVKNYKSDSKKGMSKSTSI